MICAPTGFRWTVGAAISRPKAFSLLGRRCRAYARRMRVGAGMAKALQRAGQCPAPTKGEKRFYIRRRGGCPHPPALEGTPFVGHGLPDAPFRLPAKRRRGGTLGRPPSAAAKSPAERERHPFSSTPPWQQIYRAQGMPRSRSRECSACSRSRQNWGLASSSRPLSATAASPVISTFSCSR